jgi:hypothetical protein
MPRKPKKGLATYDPPSPVPPEPPNEAESNPPVSPIRSSRDRIPTQKSVSWAEPAAQLNPNAKPKQTRLRWGPPSDVRERVAFRQAETALRAAQGCQHIPEEEEEEEEGIGGGLPEEEEDPEDEIDRQEEENLEFNQQIAYQYTVSWALKVLIGQGPIPRKAVKWQGKIGEDWSQGQFKYNALDFEFSQAMERFGFDNLIEVIITVKSTNTRGSRKSITLEELSQESWDSKIEPLLKQEHLRFLGFKLDVIVEFFSRPQNNPPPKRAYSSIESPGKSPILRRTRTV